MMKGIVYIVMVKKITERHNSFFLSLCSTQLRGKANIDLRISCCMLRALKT